MASFVKAGATEETRRRRIGLLRYHPGKVCLFVCSVLACCFSVFAASDPPSRSTETAQPKNVLVLYSFSERTLFDPLDHLKSAIRSRFNSPVNFYVHYMETQGSGDPYENVLSEALRHEFGGVKLDLVIVAAYPALQFAVTYRDQIFPGVPILFSYVHDGRLEGRQLWPGVTGVTISVGVRGTFELAFRLHPGTQNVAFVSGTSEFDQYWQAAVRNEFRQYADKVKLIEIVEMRNDEILKQVATLPAETVVFFQVTPRDSTQPAVGLYDTIAAISQRFPTYCIFANYCIDHGSVGGSYADYDDQTLTTGEMAARLLVGEKPETIPVAHGSPTRATVDWRQLAQWGIPESALPPGTIVLNRPPTAWERYRIYILAGVVLIILQAFLIGGLLLQRARRRLASENLKKVGGLLIHAQDEERATIARELHDDFSQRLALQCIELTHLGHNLPESEVEERARALNLLKESREMAADMRSLSHQLHSSRLELVGLVAALRGLCEDIAKIHEFTIHFTEPDSLPNLTKELELCLFRVAQEALANVIKHSQASSAHIELAANTKVLRLRIYDEGKGFDPDSKRAASGIGLISMRERLRLVGGKLSVRSELMRGTEVLAEIPLSASAKQAGSTESAA
jgi:signal transduction histidine kinase